jgi:RHS repeat-associated protein
VNAAAKVCFILLWLACLPAAARLPTGDFFNTFTAAPSVSVSESYDALGNVTARTLTGGRTQALGWDGRGRLVRWQETAGGGTNLLWQARHDGLGRRLRVAETRPGAPAAPTESWYDPQVEFLEVAVAYRGRRTWLLHGPDLDGRHGGLQGTGGLEGTVREADGEAEGVVADHFGHVVARVTGGGLKWSPTVVTGYGPALSFEPAKLSYQVGPAEAAGWRGRRADGTGLYWLGARYYDAAAGRFVSPDPLGHAASLSLYDYAGNDPINALDPDGRLGKAAAQSVWNGMTAGWDFLGSGMAAASLAESAMYADMMGDGEMGNALRNASRLSAEHSYQYVQSAVDQYGANLQVQDGNHFNAANMTFNPLWGAAAGSWESYQGISLNPYSLGQDLDYGGRIDAASDAMLSFLGTFGMAYGMVRPVFCFPPGTMVLMADGSTKAIERIESGEAVWADDPEDGEPAAPRRVTHLHRNWTRRLIHVAVDHDRDGRTDGEIKATGEHPFWTANRGWINAKDLNPGDTLSSADGRTPVVISVASVPTTTDTFNLTVEGSHTFFAFAGDVAVLVHNTEYDIVPFRPTNPPNFNHHGVLNVWLQENFPMHYAGYSDKSFPTVELSHPNHQLAHDVSRDFIFDRTGNPFGKVDWSTISPIEIRDLGRDMFDAASVPRSVQDEYFGRVNSWMYRNMEVNPCP